VVFRRGQNLLWPRDPAGSITQFAVRHRSGSEGIVGAPDGNVWMVARGSMNGPDWILKVSPAGVITRYPLATALERRNHLGTDGNVWFTEFWCRRSCACPRRRPDAVPDSKSQPRGIVTGPDHNLWFVDGTSRTSRSAYDDSRCGHRDPLGRQHDPAVQPTTS